MITSVSGSGEGGDIDTPPPVFPAADDLRHAIHPQVMSALAQHDWSKLTVDEKVELLRVYTLAFLRLGPPNEETRAALIKQFADELPSNVLRIDYELSQMLVYL